MKYRDNISTQTLLVLDSAAETINGLEVKSYDKESIKELVENGYARSLENAGELQKAILTGKGIEAYKEGQPLARSKD